MAKENEPAKLLLPYLQRADELQKHEPLVAYYCRLYAMERGLKIPLSERTKTTSSILNSLIKQLEKDRQPLQLGADDHLYLEGFASNVFAKADKQDRAGRADLNTAKTFYAASIFFEILNQFGDVQPDLEQKQKYAAWKAADIRKAIKEGRKPVPGPPGGDKDLFDTSSNGHDPGPSRSEPPPPTIRVTQGSHPSPQFYDRSDSQQFTSSLPSQLRDIPPPPSSNIRQPPPSNFPQPSSAISPLPPPPPPPPTYSSDEYSSSNFQQHLSQNYHNPYPQEPQHHISQNYPSQDLPFTYPNFQSYPSFSETSLPAAPAHYPSSYYQGSEPSYSPSATRPADYPSTAQYQPNVANGSGSVPAPASIPNSAQSYQYDSNYQPAPEKIAEAHKAARFAVGALAFDDVFVAVDYLKKSLELLTNPSASV
ncbi:hypothetical protein R6Q59_022400 [Mikania micrantha]|uniref:Vta1/callose synthase N-terminal domain-containing protein n=1 Tax=Mikania micrantha TaxID=192012 RepID=A0A5N6MXU1_9ASTR|nr:hypothetical protein E3N88_44664 [Mikania micrantha]KAD4178786.1 hypothetical protein E3N88_27377 [Mikania micrantha]KAD4178847.1 hypothetical protein E3N88_27438 [Mikania micrantha]